MDKSYRGGWHKHPNQEQQSLWKYDHHLKQSSPSNDVLSGFANVDELTNAGVVPILVKDLSGNSIYFSATGWVKKYPSSEFGKDLANRDWVLI